MFGIFAPQLITFKFCHRFLQLAFTSFFRCVSISRTYISESRITLLLLLLTLSDFNCVGVSGSLQSVRRPRNMIYFGHSFQISVYFPKLYFSKLYSSKQYFSKLNLSNCMHPAHASSKICKFIGRQIYQHEKMRGGVAGDRCCPKNAILLSLGLCWQGLNNIYKQSQTWGKNNICFNEKTVGCC